MRIISQDGLIDIPYEKVMIGISDQYGGAIITAIYGKRKYVLGTYSDKNVAEKSMEMLHKAYTEMPIWVQNVELDDSVQKSLSDFKKTGIILQSLEDTKPNVEYVNNIIFQFPKDDEVQE